MCTVNCHQVSTQMQLTNISISNVLTAEQLTVIHVMWRQCLNTVSLILAHWLAQTTLPYIPVRSECFNFMNRKRRDYISLCLLPLPWSSCTTCIHRLLTLYHPLFVLHLFLCFSVIFGHLRIKEQVLVSSVENGA